MCTGCCRGMFAGCCMSAAHERLQVLSCVVGVVLRVLLRHWLMPATCSSSCRPTWGCIQKDTAFGGDSLLAPPARSRVVPPLAIARSPTGEFGVHERLQVVVLRWCWGVVQAAVAVA
jgi:hypothetical protein